MRSPILGHMESESPKKPDVTPAQLRLARALMGVSARELAEKAGVSWSTVQRWELGKHPMLNNARAIVAVIEGAGVEFIEGGARLRAKP